ncbi:S9 family peptidase [Rheinheimera riviphila]|uniref:Acyl-peptide hydrolase n=1 Tax=Rheinheimera riviphila TaxID=1834037 RepID=A0A437R544_9GAMM|nr:S9 family peptidase [Rheinheimera riviphila]RVU41862.1 S9 family peptidase [Rheinheimera riviphila]
MKFTSTISILALFTTATIAAPTPLTAEKVWQVARPSGLTVSPDGQRAIFSLTKFDLTTDKGNADLQLLELGSGKMTALTSHADNDTQPAWSPDGRQVAFLSKRGADQNQLMLINVFGGEAKALTDLPVAVTAPTWFNDGKKILFVAEVPKDFDGDFNKLKTRLEAEKKQKTTAKISENRVYRFWDHFLDEGSFPQFFSLDVASGDIRQLSAGFNKIMNLQGNPQFDLSPDNKTIAVSANSSEPPYNRLNQDIYLLSTDGSGQADNITSANQADDSNPVFSSDGKTLVYGAQKRLDFNNDNVKLTHFDLTKKTATVLAANVDLSPTDWYFSKDGSMLYFTADDKAKQSLFSVPTQGGAVKQVLRQGSNEQFQLAGPQQFVLVQHSMSQMPEIFLLDNKSRTLKQISQLNTALQQQTSWGKVEEVSFAGSDGKPVQMFITYPPDFDTNKRWPLLNVLHGGPHSYSGDNFGYRWNSQVFAAAGYVVIQPNFHGSSSFGEAFTASIHGDHATKPFYDSEAAVDYMVSRGFIDESRMAAAGGSYGGYLVNWVAGHSSKYKTLISHAGVYNLMGQFSSDITQNRSEAYGGSPWQNTASMQSMNPAMFADKFQTPMLVLHGELDYRVPVTQGLELYGVLKGKGVEARLVYFPNENHWILKPNNSLLWYREFTGWLERYIGKGATP